MLQDAQAAVLASLQLADRATSVYFSRGFALRVSEHEPRLRQRTDQEASHDGAPVVTAEYARSLLPKVQSSLCAHHSLLGGRAHAHPHPIQVHCPPLAIRAEEAGHTRWYLTRLEGNDIVEEPSQNRAPSVEGSWPAGVSSGAAWSGYIVTRQSGYCDRPLYGLIVLA
jgi:hypothetical protein